MIIRTQKVIFLLARRSVWHRFKAGFKIYGWKKERKTLQKKRSSLFLQPYERAFDSAGAHSGTAAAKTLFLFLCGRADELSDKLIMRRGTDCIID